MKTFTAVIGQYLGDIRSTGGTLANASKRFFIMLTGMVIVVGVGIPYALVVVGEFLDALIGARGVGFVTSDVTGSGKILLAILILLVGTAVAVLSLRGVARQWFFQVTELVCVVLLLIVSLPSAVLRLPVQVFLTIVATTYQKRRLGFVLTALILLAFLLNAPTVLEFAVRGYMTVGQLIMCLSADVLVTCWSVCKLSPYARHN